MNSTENKFFSIRLGFIPLPLFIVLTVILAASSAFGALKANLYTGAFVCALYGCAMRYVVDHVKLIEKTIGGAFISLSCAAFVYFGLVPKDMLEAAKLFINGKIDFLTCYVLTLICGTVLTMDRKQLIRAGIRYFLPVTAGVAVAYALAGTVGELMGISWKHAIMYVAGPIMGGGNGAGAVPMSEIYAGVTGGDRAAIYAELHAMTTLGNWISIFGAILLNYIGEKCPSTTGHGALMEGTSVDDTKVSYEYKLDFNDFLVGLVFVTGIFLWGRLCQKFIPTIHAYAFSILTVALCKIFNLVPGRIEYGCHVLYQLIGKKCIVILMGGLGLTMFNLEALLKALSAQNLILCTTTVIGAIIGTWFMGRVVGFYPVESAITAGLCMSNSGGNGDVYVLTSANRMELMPFAQISSRLGGDIVLFVQSILAGLLLK